MIEKDLIVNRLIKLVSWLLVGSFLFITATGIYIKNYGDIDTLNIEQYIEKSK
jgi:hypothetical protein